MKKLRIYIDTSVIGGCFDAEFSEWSNSVAEADLLVSWNFRHIVHFDKIRLFNSVNLEMGYKPLQIYSPREVTKTEGD
jgi:hypothetical protein